MNTLTYYTKVSDTNVCNPNKTQSSSYCNTSLAYLVPRPGRNPQTIIQTLEPCTVERVQGFIFHPGVLI